MFSKKNLIISGVVAAALVVGYFTGLITVKSVIVAIAAFVFGVFFDRKNPKYGQLAADQAKKVGI